MKQSLALAIIVALGSTALWDVPTRVLTGTEVMPTTLASQTQFERLNR
jgi:hypothetical protein